MGSPIIEVLAAIATAYQLFAIIACLSRSRAQAAQAPASLQPWPVSILKPLRGADSGLRDALASHSVLEEVALEGESEVLCGVGSSDDPAARVVAEFPRLRLHICPTKTPNGKVGTLMDLAAAARYPILVVNDADISVQPDYLARVTAPLADPKVGLVTCLYRPRGETLAARFEGLGISTDFAPSTLVARLVGVDEFALGSTLAFRRTDLDRIGGFAAVADYLADDYQIGHRLHALGLKCVLAAALSGRWEIALALLALRMLMAIEAGWFVMRSPDVLRLWFLIPLRDLFAAAVWMVALFGNSVMWRGQRLRLDREGRIIRT